MEKLIGFLKELSKNNNREWFYENKKWYEESRNKMSFLTDIFINEIGNFDPTVRGLKAKDCMFRIFRDVRFSKDKRPYKTNFGSFICKSGRKSMNPGYYIHIEPAESFIAAGIYMPPAESLRIIRNYLSGNAKEFLEIIDAPDFKTEFPEMYDDKLKTAPKGFPKDHEYIRLLRYKSFLFSKAFSDKEVMGDDYVTKVIDALRRLYPVNKFLYNVIN